MAIIFLNVGYIANDDKPLPMQYVAQLYERNAICHLLHSSHYSQVHTAKKISRALLS